MSYGVTPAGFVTKSHEDILAEVQQDQWDEIAPDLDMQADGPLGIINGLLSEHLAQVWEVLHAVYRAGDPDQAEGDALQALAALTGVVKLAATYSTVDVLLTGDDLTVVTAGSRISSAGSVFETDVDATIAAATPWAALTPYTAGDLVTNDGNIYICTTAGQSAAAGGPTGTGAAIADAAAVWRYVGDGDAVVAVDATAVETGPVAANAWTLTTIETPISGWSGANNPLDAVLGRNIETDPALRARRESLLRATGNAAVDAIRAKVLDVTNVIAARVFENTSALPVGGIPAHAFEALVLGGAVDDVAQAIWDSKAAGIYSHGSTSGTAVDSLGAARVVAFSRPTEIEIEVDIVVTTDADYPVDGDDQIKVAVVAAGEALGIGADVVLTSLYGVIHGIAGVVDVTTLEIGAPVLGTANITITERQISTWDTGRVAVVS
jgi:uncharacterized phage protein gp47/JayE